jgi:hypothetical protein
VPECIEFKIKLIPVAYERHGALRDIEWARHVPSDIEVQAQSQHPPEQNESLFETLGKPCHEEPLQVTLGLFQGFAV